MIRKPLLAALLPTLLLGTSLAAACDSTSPTGQLELAPGGNYTYTAYSPSGAKVLQGSVHLEYGMMPALGAPPRALVGTWAIDWVPGADRSTPVGPQVGSGQMDGQTDDSGVKLAFLPNIVDSGAYLTGLVYGSAVSGTWHWSTIAGPSEQGRFTLVPVH